MDALQVNKGRQVSGPSLPQAPACSAMTLASAMLQNPVEIKEIVRIASLFQRRHDGREQVLPFSSRRRENIRSNPGRGLDESVSRKTQSSRGLVFQPTHPPWEAVVKTTVIQREAGPLIFHIKFLKLGKERLFSQVGATEGGIIFRSL